MEFVKVCILKHLEWSASWGQSPFKISIECVVIAVHLVEPLPDVHPYWVSYRAVVTHIVYVEIPIVKKFLKIPIFVVN